MRAFENDIVPMSTPPSSLRWVMVITVSAGGVPALAGVLSGLPVDFTGAVLIVQRHPGIPGSILEKVLQRATALTVRSMHDGQEIVAGVVYVAPPGQHAIVTPQHTLSLFGARRIEHVGSSANPLFESAAAVFGEAAVAVVLPGSGTDTTDGVQRIRSQGGMVIAQDEATFLRFVKPRTAIETGAVNLVLRWRPSAT